VGCGTPQSWLPGTVGSGIPQSWLPGRGLAGGTPQSWFSSPSVTLVARSAAAPAATSVRLSEPAPVAVAWVPAGAEAGPYSAAWAIPWPASVSSPPASRVAAARAPTRTRPVVVPATERFTISPSIEWFVLLRCFLLARTTLPSGTPSNEMVRVQLAASYTCRLLHEPPPGDTSAPYDAWRRRCYPGYFLGEDRHSSCTQGGIRGATTSGLLGRRQR